MTRWIGWIILALLAAGIFLLSIGAGLVATEGGSRWLIGQALSLSGAPIDIEGVSGRLLTTLRIGRLRYSSATMDVNVSEVTIDPTWTTLLLDNRMTFERVAADSVEITTVPGDAPRERAPALPALPIPVEILSAELRALRVNDIEPTWLPALTTALEWDERALVIRQLHAISPRYVVDADATLAAGGRLMVDSTLRGSLQWQGADEAMTYEGTVSLSGPIDALRVAGSLDAPWHIDFEGAVEPLRPDPVFSMDVRASELEWQGYRASTLAAHVAGTRSSYAGRVSVHVATPFSIEGDFRTELQGDPTSARLSNVDLRTNVAAASGSATVIWSPAISAEFSGNVRDADPSMWVPELPGRIAAAVSGTFTDGKLAVAVEDVNGELAGRPVAGHAQLREQDGEIELDGVEVVSGNDRAAGSGRWSKDSLAVSAEFALTDLATFVPALAGDAAGTIEGSRSGTSWSGVASIRSRQLRYAGVAVENVTVDADRTEAGRSRLRARIASAAFRESELGRLSIDAAGPDDNLVVGITTDGAPGQTSVDATLAIRDRAVLMNVARGATLALPGGEWRLDKSTTVDVASAAVAVSSHCWRAHEGALCVDGIRWRGDQIDSKGQLTDLPVATIAWLDPALESVRGSVEGDWTIERRGNEWRGAAKLATVDFRYDPDVEEGDEVALPPVRATLVLAAEGGSVTLTIGSKESQMLVARARTRGYDIDAPIEGSVGVTIEDLTELETLSERASKTKGRITGSLAVAGTLRAPLVNGHVRLQDGALEWLDPHLDLKQIELDLALVGDGAIRIDGSARSRDSDLRVTGSMTDVFAGTRHLHLSLTSDPVQVAMPDMELTVVPAIDFDWSNQAASLTGVVRLPDARIEVSRLPEGATPRSEDVVVIGREDEREQETSIEADLRIELGGDVQLTAFGLETRLTGEVRLREEKGGSPQLFGRIDLVGGSYSAYGRTLAIESGRLLFQGPPDDPDVDIRAVRKIERPEPEQAVTVGVRVRGHAKALESTLFSDPPMAESDALSYLVMGRPLRQTTENEGQDLSGIAVALGLAQATGIVNQIRTRIGLDELGAGTSAEQETTVVAGKQVASKLYARYTYNTFTRLSALMLRYDLTRKLSLEATAGEAPGMDVIYRVGRE